MVIMKCYHNWFIVLKEEEKKECLIHEQLLKHLKEIWLIKVFPRMTTYSFNSSWQNTIINDSMLMCCGWMSMQALIPQHYMSHLHRNSPFFLFILSLLTSDQHVNISVLNTEQDAQPDWKTEGSQMADWAS